MKDRKFSVLIVDDDVAIRDYINEGLTGEGYSCKLASNGNEAINELRCKNFDILLLDIRLPGRSGIDLIKKYSLVDSSIVILITAIDDIDTAIQTMKLGVSDYIVKPFTIGKLINSISSSLKLYSILGMNSLSPLDVAPSMRRNPNKAINALAAGVEAQVDGQDSHSRVVTLKTVRLALDLGLPDKDIKKWVSVRQNIEANRSKYLNSLLGRYKGKFLDDGE